MKHKKRLFFLLPVVILIIIFAVRALYLHNTFSYNDDFVNGNLPGNLYNGGAYCESNGTVFFSNPDDGYALYAMALDGTDLRKLSNDYATYINADDNYVYYVRNNIEGSAQFSFFRWNTNSLCRIPREGGDVTILDPKPCMYACLNGNYLYYLHYEDNEGTTLYKVNIDGTECKQIMAASYIMCDATGKYIYYNGVEKDHNLYRLDTTSDISSLLYEGNCYNPIMLDNCVYFMDPDNNYSLAKLDFFTGEKTTLTTDRIDCFAIQNQTVYYQKNDANNPALCKISLDGSNAETLVSGNYTELNLTSNYLYMKRFGNDSILYRMTLDGSNTVEEFHPGVIKTDDKK